MNGGKKIVGPANILEPGQGGGRQRLCVGIKHAKGALHPTGGSEKMAER